jgi:sulfonate transport system substrate-binding protein
VTVRVGYQKLAIGSNIARLQGTLDRDLAARGVHVQWLNFPAGPELMQAMGTGNVDIGGGADTVPIFAQAANVPFVYVANTPLVKQSIGIAVLVHNGSTIRTVDDLKGKTVAIVKGTGSQYFFVQVLERAHVDYSDVKPVYLEPADAFAAFASGRIDAWVAWDPYITIAKEKVGARVLVDQTGIPSNTGFILASRRFATEHPDLIGPVLSDSAKAGEWAAQHPQDAVKLLQNSAGMDPATLEKLVRSGSGTRYLPIDDKILALQQKEADEFYRLGLLRKKIDVKDATLPADQYARISLGPSS